MNKIFTKILAETRRGMRRAMLMSRGRPYVLPAEGAFARDAASLRRDAERLVRDMNEQFTR